VIKEKASDNSKGSSSSLFLMGDDFDKEIKENLKVENQPKDIIFTPSSFTPTRSLNLKSFESTPSPSFSIKKKKKSNDSTIFSLRRQIQESMNQRYSKEEKSISDNAISEEISNEVESENKKDKKKVEEDSDIPTSIQINEQKLNNEENINEEIQSSDLLENKLFESSQNELFESSQNDLFENSQIDKSVVDEHKITKDDTIDYNHDNMENIQFYSRDDIDFKNETPIKQERIEKKKSGGVSQSLEKK